MNSHKLGPCTLGICMTAVSLAGCGGAGTPVPAARGGASGVRIELLHGGAFSAKYSGRFHVNYCGLVCQDFVFNGTGKASFLFASNESGNARVLPVRHTFNGSAILISSKMPANNIQFRISGALHSACPGPISWKVIGGYGKFAHATGSGSIAFTCNVYNYVDRWSGTIHF